MNGRALALVLILQVICFFFIALVLHRRDSNHSRNVNCGGNSHHDVPVSVQVALPLSSPSTNTCHHQSSWLQENHKSKNDKKPYYITMLTQLILREHIHFLEEWLWYHIHIVNVDQIYIFDNTGSTTKRGAGNSVAQTGKNKYGYSLKGMTSTMSDHDVDMVALKIFAKFPGKITYTNWRPRNKNGEIEYQQAECIDTAMRTFVNQTTWMAVIDLDEFLYVNTTTRSIHQYLREKEDLGFSRISIKQRKYKHKFEAVNEGLPPPYLVLSIQDYYDFERDGFVEWARKNIIRVDHYQSTNNIHDIRVNGPVHPDGNRQLFFSHYNHNQQNWDWMRKHFNKTHVPATVTYTDRQDQLMQPFVKMLMSHSFVPLPRITNKS